MWAGANAHRIVIRALIVRPLFLIVGARLPAICREPAADPIHAVYQAQPSRQILLPLRGRSSECGPEQARSYRYRVDRMFPLRLLLLILFFDLNGPTTTKRDLGAG